MVEYRALVERVGRSGNVAVERQIRVAGPDAEAFVNRVITRDATRIRPMNGKYVILCNEKGGNPQRSSAASGCRRTSSGSACPIPDVMFWLQGCERGHEGRRGKIDEIDVCPLQIQGPRSADLMVDLIGGGRFANCRPTASWRPAWRIATLSCRRPGSPAKKGLRVFYLRDATLHAEKLWNAILEAGEAHDLMVIAPAHHRRNRGRYPVLGSGHGLPRPCPFSAISATRCRARRRPTISARRGLEEVRALVEAGTPPLQADAGRGSSSAAGRSRTTHRISGSFPGRDGGEPVGYVTSPWYSPRAGNQYRDGLRPPARWPHWEPG